MTATDRSSRPRPVVLCILDGWGHRADPADDNAIRKARTPNFDSIAGKAPRAFLQASELHVGLPRGQMGNSEVGHMNLGAGRVVMQDLPRIDQAIESGELAASPVLRAFVERMKQSGGTVHLMGLLSPGGVHSHQDHMAALARLLTAAGLVVAVHAFLDGRDTPPRSAEGFLAKFERDLAAVPGAALASISGRYYAMDRDKRWDRVEKACATLMDGTGERADNWRAALAAAYGRNETDEFVRPTALGDHRGMKNGDGLLMANFRADRARQLLGALLDPAFDGFARPRQVAFAAALGMVEYSTSLNRFLDTLFAPEQLNDLLGDVVANAGLKQLRIAETEKYAHVTFFFDGGSERDLPGASRVLVPSPKVATYDLQPEMSAAEVTDRLVEAIRDDAFDFIVVNYANTDMVGHTGDISAAVRAVEAVDACIGRLSDAVAERGGALLITADHGNAEMMRDPETHQPHTAHTLNPVPILLVESESPGRNAPRRLIDGKLADVAPTVLELLRLPQPAAMTGRSLIAPPDEASVARA